MILRPPRSTPLYSSAASDVYKETDITPALVGGQDGQMVSNIIDFHMRKSLNWNLAAALGLVMLVFVMFLFWVYDRVVGIDNMKLG